MTIDMSELSELAPALAKAQAAMQPANKERVNPHFKSRYADLSAIWDACRVPLTSNGLSIIQMPVDMAEPNRVGLSTLLLHSSGQYIRSSVSVVLTKNDAQGIGSALTYLRRYALAAMVGIVADEDDDGNAARQQQASYQPSTGQKMTGPQRKKLWATMQANQWDEEGVITWIAQHDIVVTKLRDLTSKQAQEVIDLLTQAAKTPDAENKE